MESQKPKIDCSVQINMRNSALPCFHRQFSLAFVAPCVSQDKVPGQGWDLVPSPVGFHLCRHIGGNHMPFLLWVNLACANILLLNCSGVSRSEAIGAFF